MNIFLEAADILSRVTTTDKYALVVRSLIESSGEKAVPASDRLTVPCENAPLPAEVKEAMEQLTGDVYELAGNLLSHHPDLAKSNRSKSEAALAVIRAALTATIKPPLTVAQTTKVTREWVSWFVKTLFDMKMRGVTFPVEGAAETMLQSVGIEVEP